MFSKLSKIALSLTSSLALLLAVYSVSQICFFCLHQPDVPDSLKKLED